MIKKALALAAFLVVAIGFSQFFAGVAYSQSLPGGMQSISVPITGGGSTEPALLSLPNDYNSTSQSYPLLVFLHGAGEAGTSLSKIYGSSTAGGPMYFIAQGTFPTSFTVNGSTYKFIVVAPQASGWSTSSTSLNYILSYLASNYRVDTNRIYTTGLSAGGEGVTGQVVHIDLESGTSITPSYKVAAFVPMSSASGSPATSWGTTTVNDGIHVWGFGSPASDVHGENTQIYTTYVNNAGAGYARFTNYSGGHCCWGQFYNPSYTESISGTAMNIYQWMLQYSRGGSTPPPPTNQSPTANAGSNQTITLPTSSVMLNGSGTDSDGGIASYSWTKTSGGTATIASPSAASTSVTGLSQGTYTFKLTVTDNGGATATDTVTVTVNAQATTPPSGGNRTFYIDFGGNQPTTQSGWNTVSSAAAGTSIALKDSVNGASTVGVTITDAFNDENIAGTTASSVYPATATNDSFFLGTVGSVTDNNAQVQVSGLSNGATYTFIFYASRVAGDNGNRTTQYTIGSTTVSLNATDNINNTAQIANVTPSGGTVTINISKVSDYGYLGVLQINESSSGTPANQSPTANAGADKAVTLPTSSVTLSGSGSDSDGSISSYAWTKVSGTGGTISAPSSASTAVTGLSQGVYTYRLTVTDNQGATATDDVNVTVNSASNQAPVANAGSDQSITLPTSAVTLSGSGTDSDGSIASYAWTKTSGGTATIASPSAASTAVTGLSQGSYTFRLTVTDNGGATATDDVVVTVNASGSGVCNGVRRVINPASNIGAYGRTLDGNTFVYNPGDTLVLQAQYNPWSWLEIFNIHGTANCPVTITNEGGQINLTDNINITDSTYLKILGNGTPGVQYGFRIENPLNGATYRFGMEISGKVAHIELANIEMNHVTTGFVVRNEGSCDATVNSWIMDDFVIHDNHITNTANQGMYLGTTAPNNGPNNGDPRPIVCNGVTTYPNGSRVGNFKIYNNIVDTTGRPGIQLSSASTGTSEIYSNTVTNSGNGTDEDQGVGISLGGYTNAYVHNNTVRNSYTWGISSLGATGVTIENNTVSGSGIAVNGHQISWPASNIYIGTRNTVPTTGTTFTIRNNTLSNPGVGAQHIIVDRDYDGYSSPQLHHGYTLAGNGICGNTGNGGSATIKIDPTIQWSTTCTSGVVNVAPALSAGNDQTVSGTTATLAGSASDPDGIGSYSWTKTAGPSATIASPSSATTAVSGLTPGAYLFQLTAADAKGATHYDDTQVIVNPSVAACPAKKVVIIGSSTAEGQGASPAINAWASRYASYLKAINPANTLVNLAVGGTNTYQGMPTGSSVPSGYAGPDPAHNITAAIAQGANAIIVGYVSNDSASGFSLIEQQTNFRAITSAADAAGIPIFVTTTQPRDDLSQTQRNMQMTMRDWILSTYGTRAIDAWTGLANPDGTIIPAMGEGGGIHLGDYGHRLIFNRIVNAGIVQTMCGGSVTPPPTNASPVANAGADMSITLPTSSVTLIGSGTDSDGTIASYQWTKTNGGTATIASPNSASTNITGLAIGSYTFRLTVTDNGGASSFDDVLVVVNAAPNNPPSANAGSDITITLPTNTATLIGSGTDNDGSIATYAWTKVSGQGTISSPSNATTTITGLTTAGTSVFHLTVTDNQGATATDSVSVFVNPVPNTPPTVNAGLDVAITLPVSSVTLTATASDPNGDTMTYVWTKTSGGTATIASPSAKATSVSGLTAGTYTFQFTATDSKGATASDTVSVTVNAAIPVNNAPIVNAGLDKSITLPTSSITLTATATDPDSDTMTYSWTKVSGPATPTIGSASSLSTSVSALSAAGNYTFRFTATDSKGLSTSDDVVVIVNGAVVTPNNAPIVSAGINQTITLPISSVVLAATASDPDGDTMTYAWTKSSGGTATIGSPASLGTTISNLATGTYTFQFTATDAKGASTSDTVTVTVNAAVVVNVPPVVSAGAGQTITLPTNSVTLNGSATDSDGTIATVLWTKVSGPTVIIVSPALLSTAASNLVEGTYVFSLTATDNKGATGSDSVTITVNPQPTTSGGGGGGGGGGGSSHGGGSGGSSGGGKGHGKPTALAGNDVTIAAPIDSVVLIGSGDSIDGAVTYEWSKTSGSGGTIEYPTRSTTTVKGLKKGNYTFELTVTDINGNDATDFVNVTVLDANTILPVSNTNTTATTTTISGGGSSGSAKVRTTASSLNVRSAPVSGSVIAKVPFGTNGTLITSANGWYQVQFDSGVTGWVSSTYATVTAPTSTPVSSGSSSSSGTVTASRLNVRSAPVSGSVISQVTAGTTLPILSTSGGWSQVQLPTGSTGWVSNAYLSGITSTPAPTPLPAPTTSGFTAGQTVTTTASSLNVRSAPAGTVIGKVPAGTTGTVLSQSGEWVQIFFGNGTAGYVSSAYLR